MPINSILAYEIMHKILGALGEKFLCLKPSTFLLVQCAVDVKFHGEQECIELSIITHTIWKQVLL